MQRKNILAHRGLWSERDETNTRDALAAALGQGFGIETDLRDATGDLVVSHDPPTSGSGLSADALLSDCAGAAGGAGRLALNIKADGLQASLHAALDRAGIAPDRAYVFDMSVPDTLGYLAAGMPVYTRISEYEPNPAFLDRASGVWVDNFTGAFAQVDAARRMLERGLRVAIVSPELHGRPPEPLWDEIAAAGLHRHPSFEICTDFPVRAHEVLGEKP